MNQLELTLSDSHTPIPAWMIAPEKLEPDTKWRIVKLGDQMVGFVLIRSRRRSIGFVIGEQGLRVTAPNWVTLQQIDSAVIEKMPWIMSKLKNWQSRKEQLAMSHTRWQSGGELPYLGCKITLRNGIFQPQAVGSQAVDLQAVDLQALDLHAQRVSHGGPFFDGNLESPEPGQALWLPLPHDADANRMRDMAQAWLQNRARSWFAQRLKYFTDVTGLHVRKWRLSSAATRWGSCTSDGSIMLNWRLIHFTPMIIDYVIAHELAHLREMNHSHDFWAEVQQLYPDYQSARQMLNQHTPDGVPEI